MGNTARELKSGKISLTDAFKRQVRKDLEIIKAQGDLVDKVEWHALNGIENDALKFVRDEMTLPLGRVLTTQYSSRPNTTK